MKHRRFISFGCQHEYVNHYKSSLSSAAFAAILVFGFAAGVNSAVAQSSTPVNVVMGHNDIGRTGQNLSETTLTPANVNPTKFGKLFSQTINGAVYAQPLYVSQVAIPGNGTHNVVYVATYNDVVYAFDADNNGGANASPLWQTSLLASTSPAGAYISEYGVMGTPVIDLTTNTMYLVSGEEAYAATQQTGKTTYVFRLHALDITTGAEKFGGPVNIQASVPGTGNGSVAGTLTFDPLFQIQRPGLLLLNGVVYLAFASENDAGPWHGWLFSYSAATLNKIDAFCTTPNGVGGGIWMGGAGLAAEVNNTAKPYGRMFVATGNGTFAASQPYTRQMEYGMSLLNLDLSNGKFTVEDEFTPFNQASLDAQDGDLGSGGPVLLPTQVSATGANVSTLVQIGKSGMFYILNRNNLGGSGTTADDVFQEVQTPQTGGTKNWGAGVWGSTAYFNNNVYFEGTDWGGQNPLTAYSFAKDVLSATPTSVGTDKSYYPGATPSISANKTTDGIVWRLRADGVAKNGPGILFAYNANSLATALYSSNTNLSRDNPGGAVKYTVPTIANGKVYVGAVNQVSIYGLLGVTPTVAPPVFSPSGAAFTGSQPITITDATSGAKIYYTTDGSTPTVASTLYTGPIAVNASETITAIASAPNYLQGAPTSATFTVTSDALNPTFSLGAGTYAGAQTLSISDASSGAVIHYTVNGTTPTTASPVYTKSITIPVGTETVQAIAVAPGLLPSNVTSGTFTVTPAYSIDYSQGFTLAQGPVQFNGNTNLDDFRLQLTDGGIYEAGSAFYATPVNIQSFTTNFTFQLSNPIADGVTFTIQNVGPTALGIYGKGLGYAGLAKSLALKFDLHSNSGEGPDSTGLYLNGAMPTVPAVNLTPSGVDLHSGDYMNAQVTYNGATLTLTLTDAITLATFTQSFTVNIPSVVGGNTAYVGFTGGTGSSSASQKFTSWTYLVGMPSTSN